MNEEFEREWNLRQVESGCLHGQALGEIVRRGTIAIQEEAGLKVDALCGPNTVLEVEGLLGINQPQPTQPLRGRRRSIPDVIPIPTPRGITTVYGDPSYRSHPQKPGALIIDKDWVKKNIVKVTLHTGQHTYCHRLVSCEMKRLYKRACEETGYTPTRVWSWVARRKMWSESKGPSLHSYGIAFDIDWHLIPYGSTGGTPVHESHWYEVWEAAGWSWGGRWSTPDPHHFERVRR